MSASLQPLPPSEWRIMCLIWRHGSLTVNEVLSFAPEYSVTTVATFLRRLVSKGYLSTSLEPPPPGGGRPPERFHARVDYGTGVDLAVERFLHDYIDDSEGLARLAMAIEQHLAPAEKPVPAPQRARPKRVRGKAS